MAGTNQFTNYPCEFNGGTPFNLTQLVSGSYAANANEDAIIPAGDYKRAAVITNSIAPTFSFQSTDLTTLLTAITSVKEGYACTSGANIYYRQRSSGSIFESGSTAFKLASHKGHLILDSLSVSGPGPVNANLTYHELWDGTNDVAVPTASQALGAAAAAFVSQFYRGTVTVNGTAIDNVMGVTVDFGLKVDKEIYSGDHAPRTLAVVTVEPIITIEAADLAEFASKIVNSHGTTFTNLIVYFKKGASGGLRGGSGTALSITATSGKMTATGITGGGTGNSSVALQFMPTVDLSFSLSATHP